MLSAGRRACAPSCLLGWCWRVQLWRTRSGQTHLPARVWRADARGLINWLLSNESKRGVNPTHTEPQPDTAGGKHHRGETAHGGNSTRGNPPANSLCAHSRVAQAAHVYPSRRRQSQLRRVEQFDHPKVKRLASKRPTASMDRSSPASERARRQRCPRIGMGAGVYAGPSWPRLKGQGAPAAERHHFFRHLRA